MNLEPVLTLDDAHVARKETVGAGLNVGSLPGGVTTDRDDFMNEKREVYHVDGAAQVDPGLQAGIDKMAVLLRREELIRTGNAAVDKFGRVVDRRLHPYAVPIIQYDNNP